MTWLVVTQWNLKKKSEMSLPTMYYKVKVEWLEKKEVTKFEDSPTVW